MSGDQFRPNASGGITNPMTTKGDLITSSDGLGTPTRVGVGTNGQAVAADSTATNGLSYQSLHYMKNRLINGAFDWWQAGTSATVTATGGGSPTATYLYQADQWYVNNILGGGTVEGVITYSQVTGVTAGSLYGASVKITTAPTGTGIQNGCELYQTLSNRASIALYNQTASFTVLVKALGNINQVGVQFYYKTSEAKVDSVIGSEVLTTVNTSTFVACTINGQALGTSMTTSGVIGVRIRPTNKSSGNLYDLNNGFVCEQAILNIGPVAMPFSRQYEDPVNELAACKYFYQVITQGELKGAADSTTAFITSMAVSPPMRSAPTLTLLTSTPVISEISIADRTGSGSALTSTITSANAVRFNITGFSSLTAKNPMVGASSGYSNGVVSADARI